MTIPRFRSDSSFVENLFEPKDCRFTLLAKDVTNCTTVADAVPKFG